MPPPIQSMTGAGFASGTTECGPTTVELRSVNGRGLLLKTRVDPQFAGLEPALETRVRAQVRRGTITLAVACSGTGGSEPLFDAARAERAVQELQALAARLGIPPAIDLATLLALPGIAIGAAPARALPGAEPPPALAALLDAALAQLHAHRLAEGRALAHGIGTLLAELAALRAQVAARAPQIVAEQRTRIQKRVNEFLEGHGRTLGDADVLKEVALFADRVDVTEELERLDQHLERARATLAAGGELGRVLDFLLQEVLREVNTIGSKAQDAAVAHTVVAMKLLVEKMKEQAANLE